MQIEQVSALERRVQISVPLAEIAKEVESRLKRLSRSVKMQGFRPGKVPLKLVAQNYGFQVQNEVVSERINDAVSKVISDAQLRVAGQPRVEPKAAEEGSEASESANFIATFEVFPEIVFGDWKTAEVERVESPVTDVEIDKTIEILRKQRQTWADVDRAAEDGDRVTCDFVGRLDGVEFEGGKAQDFVFVIGAKQMLPEFEQGALGLKAGDSRTFSMSFPADYHGKDVAGKTAEFDITIKAVAGSVLPEVDAEFAKQLGVEDGDLSKMRDDVRTNLEREIGSRTKARTKDSVMNALLKVAEFEVPKALIEQDIERLREMARNDLKQRGMQVDDSLPFPDELFQAQAERRVRLGLAIGEIVNRNGLNASQDQVRLHIEDFAKSYEDPASVMAWYFSDRKRLADVEAVVLEDNVVNWVLGQANVTEKAVSFDELMNAAN
ncbi:trigger factor [Derxia lacustris]|uniref:trigger factor n=1 Tax=Derxia lacustris TaxID=764842 RepID=UPI000A170893|nr:trigger factor [Derxia lacustris]